jgi:hypothetical protein
MCAMKLPPNIQEFFKKSGAKGGRARSKSLSAKRRREIASNASKARWEKKGRKK